jgi:hypothetical protein
MPVSASFIMQNYVIRKNRSHLTGAAILPSMRGSPVASGKLVFLGMSPGLPVVCKAAPESVFLPVPPSGDRNGFAIRKICNSEKSIYCMIKEKARNGANILIALALLAIFVSAFVVMQIRYGGPIFQKYALQDTLIADILPPPEYVVEPYLEATLLLVNPGEVTQKSAYLAQLHRDYEDRKTYWAGAALSPEQRRAVEQCETLPIRSGVCSNSVICPRSAPGGSTRRGVSMTTPLPRLISTSIRPCCAWLPCRTPIGPQSRARMN